MLTPALARELFKAAPLFGTSTQPMRARPGAIALLTRAAELSIPMLVVSAGFTAVIEGFLEAHGVPTGKHVQVRRTPLASPRAVCHPATLPQPATTVPPPCHHPATTLPRLRLGPSRLPACVAWTRGARGCWVATLRPCDPATLRVTRPCRCDPVVTLRTQAATPCAQATTPCVQTTSGCRAAGVQ